MRHGPGSFCRCRLALAFGSGCVVGVGLLLAGGAVASAAFAGWGKRVSRLMNKAVMDAMVAMPTNAEKIATSVGDSSRAVLVESGAAGARPDGSGAAKSSTGLAGAVSPRPMASSS